MSILDGGNNNAILESSGVNGGYSSIPIQGTGSVSVSVDNGSLLVNGQESNPQIEFASNVAGAELNLSSNSGDTSSLPIQGTGSVSVSVDSDGKLLVSGEQSNPQIEFASNEVGAELNLSSNSGDTFIFTNSRNRISVSKCRQWITFSKW